MELNFNGFYLKWQPESQQIVLFNNLNQEVISNKTTPLTFSALYNFPFRSRKIQVKNKTRQIDVISRVFDKKQIKEIYKYILASFDLHESVTASFDKGIVFNASKHSNAKELLKIDIKNFYDSTTRKKILEAVEKYKPEEYSFMSFIQNYWSIQRKLQTEPCLPTGASTSPHLANFALRDIDEKIHQYIKEQGGNYTRYLDDFIISFDNELEPLQKKKIFNYVAGLITGSGYKLNLKKSKWINFKHDKLIITGVDIRNNEIKVNNSNIRKTLRPEIESFLSKLDYYRLTMKLINSRKKIKDFDNNWRYYILNPKINGYLSYVKSVSQKQYLNLLSYIEKRIKIHSLRNNNIDKFLETLKTING